MDRGTGVNDVKLPTAEQIKRVLKVFQDQGIAIGRVDILADGVSVHPPGETEGKSAYDLWKEQDDARNPHS
jgi:hypothetical protein